eukprot:1625405-Amphidinium_carterae.1
MGNGRNMPQNIGVGSAGGPPFSRLNPDYSTTDAYIAVLNKFLQAVEPAPKAPPIGANFF